MGAAAVGRGSRCCQRCQHRQIRRLHRRGGGKHRQIRRLHRRGGGKHRQIRRLHRRGGGKHRQIRRLHRRGGGEHRQIRRLHRRGGGENRRIQSLADSAWMATVAAVVRTAESDRSTPAVYLTAPRCLAPLAGTFPQCSRSRSLQDRMALWGLSSLHSAWHLFLVAPFPMRVEQPTIPTAILPGNASIG